MKFEPPEDEDTEAELIGGIPTVREYCSLCKRKTTHAYHQNRGFWGDSALWICISCGYKRYVR